MFGFDELWSQIDFRLTMAYEVVAAPRWSFENALLPQAELWLVRGGRCHVQSGNRRALAKNGDLVFLRAGEYRLTTEADGAPLDIIGFGFRAHLLGSVELIDLLDPPLCFPNRDADLQTSMENLTRESHEQKIGYGLATTAYAQLAVVEALRQGLRDENQNATNRNAANRNPELSSDDSIKERANDDFSDRERADFGLQSDNRVLDMATNALPERVLQKLQSAQNGDIAQALQIVASRYAEPLDVAQMAKSLHLSAPHFSRKFKAALGMAPVEYLRVYRLRQARARLSQSDDAVSQVAQSCGFADAAYFSRAFKAQFGSSPLEFRRYLRALSK